MTSDQRSNLEEYADQQQNDSLAHLARLLAMELSDENATAAIVLRACARRLERIGTPAHLRSF